MSVKFPSTKITNASIKVDKYLNVIYKLKNEIEERGVEMELLEDIESWRTCLDEIELAIKSQYQSNENYYEIDNENKELIIY